MFHLVVGGREATQTVERGSKHQLINLTAFKTQLRASFFT